MWTQRPGDAVLSFDGNVLAIDEDTDAATVKSSMNGLHMCDALEAGLLA